MVLLEGVALTDSGRPVLAPEELELRILDKTDAEFGEQRGGLATAPDERYKGGLAFLTTHRLIWLDQLALPNPGRSCSLHLSRITGSTPVGLKMFGSRTKRQELRCRACGGLGTPLDTPGIVRFAFRGESPSDFVKSLDEALARAAWRSEENPRGEDPGHASGVPRVYPPPPPSYPRGSRSDARRPSADQARSAAAKAENDSNVFSRRAGVGGALARRMDLSNESEKTLGQAFTDMAAVIESAGELVRLAERFASAVLSTREKESTETASSPASSVARAEMREMLVSVGVASPVTKETAGASYHKQLSRQLADWLSDAFENERRVDGCGGSLKASRGNILALPDVFCLFNRARGTELVSPEDVLRACQLWKSLGITSVRVKRFETSGLLVVHAADTSDDEVCGTLARLLESGADTPGDESSPARWKRIDASGASEALRVPPYVAGEYLRMAEGHGILCRDEAPETTWFYPNRFAEFQYDRRVEVS